MNDNSIILIGIVLFVCLAIVSFLLFRRRVNVKIKAPLGLGIEIDAENDSHQSGPAITIEDVRSKSGGLIAEDTQGRGVNIKHVEASGDIQVKSGSDVNFPKV